MQIKSENLLLGVEKEETEKRCDGRKMAITSRGQVQLQEVQRSAHWDPLLPSGQTQKDNRTSPEQEANRCADRDRQAGEDRRLQSRKH